MPTLAPRGQGRSSIALLACALVIATCSAVLLPSPARIALAKDGVALGDTVILAGPGGQYGILTVAPAGAVMSVDGDAVDGYYPVTFDGIGGWTATGLVEVTGGGGDGSGGNGGGGSGNGGGHDGRSRESGNGGVETVNAAPILTDGGEPIAAAPTATDAEPVTGGVYGPGGSGYSEQQITDIIYEAAGNYGQSPDDMLRVARCESGLDPHAVGGGGAYHGLFQFVPSTFANTPYGQYDIYDPWANANAAAWMWSEGGKGSWTCQ